MTNSNSIDATQDDILEYLRMELAQPVYEEGIPTGTTVKRDAKGQVDPYVTIQFGDTYARGGKTFNGQRTYDYSLPVATQVISPDPTVGRKLSNRIMDLLLGKQFPYAPGGVNKVPVGGAIMTISQSDAATQAYMVPSWYRVTIQYVAEGDVPDMRGYGRLVFSPSGDHPGAASVTGPPGYVTGGGTLHVPLEP